MVTASTLLALTKSTVVVPSPAMATSNVTGGGASGACTGPGGLSTRTALNLGRIVGKLVQALHVVVLALDGVRCARSAPGDAHLQALVCGALPAGVDGGGGA